MTIRVKPSGNQWVVTKNGATVSNHRKKSRAKKSAKRKASDGEQIIEHGRGGQIIDRRRRRRGR
jgi:hypothetical protein